MAMQEVLSQTKEMIKSKNPQRGFLSLIKRNIIHIGFYVFLVLLLIHIGILTLFMVDSSYDYKILNHSYISAIGSEQTQTDVFQTSIMRTEPFDINTASLGTNVVVCCVFGTNEHWVMSIVDIDKTEGKLSLTYDGELLVTMEASRVKGVYDTQAGLLGSIYYTAMYPLGYSLFILSPLAMLAAYYVLLIYKPQKSMERLVKTLQSLTDKYKEELAHSRRVSDYCKSIGNALGLSRTQQEELALAGMVHDVGKVRVPDSILNKPGSLTDKEWVVMRKHTLEGYHMLKSIKAYAHLAQYAISHHERVDGDGYPKGLKQESIPLFSRIISVADAYEAITSDRPYRKARTSTEAIRELKKHAGSQFDPQIVDTFVSKVL